MSLLIFTIVDILGGLSFIGILMEVFSVIRNCSNFCLQMFWSLEKWWVYFVCMINKGLSRSFVPTIDKIQLWQYSSTAILIDAFLRLRLQSDLEQLRRIGCTILPVDDFNCRHTWIILILNKNSLIRDFLYY